jgi:hypothetical protein
MKMKKMMMVIAAALLSGTASAGYVQWDVAGLMGMGHFPGDSENWDYMGGDLSMYQPFAFALVLQDDIGAAVSAIAGNLGSIGSNENAVFLDWMWDSGIVGQTIPQMTGNVPKISSLDTLNYAIMVFTYYDEEWYYTTSTSMAYKGHASSGQAAEPPQLTFTDDRFTNAWVLIPEPTAMALLALGAAAVGLRRRFRK